jgi:integrase/recombinase XerD
MPQKTTETWHTLLLRFERDSLEHGAAPTTVKSYLCDLRIYAQWHTSVYGSEPDGLTEIDVRAFKTHMQTGERLAPSTVNRRLAAVKALSSFLASNSNDQSDVTAGIPFLKVQIPTAPDVPDHAHLLRLFKQLDTSDWRGLRDYAIVQLFVQTGIRVGELVKVDLRDIEMSERGGRLRIPDGKGGKPREVPLNVTARKAVQQYLDARPAVDTGKLFLSTHGKPISRRAVQHMVTKLMRRAGIEDGGCHLLRALFATSLYQQSKDVVLTQKLLGHANIQTTVRYTRQSAAEEAEALENMPGNVMK